MSNISDEEIERQLKDLERLEEMPAAVSERFEATLNKLLAEEKIEKRTWNPSSSWAIAAGFTLIFAIGAFLNINSDSGVQIPINDKNSVKPLIENPDGDILVSAKDLPVLVNEDVPFYASNSEYSNGIDTAKLPFDPDKNYRKISNLEVFLQSCIKSIGLEDSVSFLDRGLYESRSIIAVWSNLDKVSWQVFILDDECNGLDEILVNENR